MGSLKATIRSLEKRRDRLIEQIAKYEEESQCEKRKEEVALTKKKMEKINEKIVREARRIPGKIRELEQEIHRSEMTANNALMRFGENVPRILEVMNANAERFDHLPKGPIGMHIKVRDRRWAFAIEEATRRLLTSFVFNSKRDHQVFERLMRSNRIGGALPNAIFAKFNVPPHDVRYNEPSSEWDTILRMVEVKDPVVSAMKAELTRLQREQIRLHEEAKESQEAEMQEKIRRIAVDIESDTRRAARIQESFGKIDENMRELEVKKEEAEKTAERSKELPTPSSMSNPPDMEQLGDTTELDEQYKTLTLKIESAEKVIGRTITLEQLQSFKDSYEASKKQYLELKALNRKLSECLKIRKEKFPIMCHAITMRLKMTFQRLMATRSYHGKLAVDRQKEVINISVATHQKDDNAQAVTKKCGLSGGERSFTTACFIMALWEIMEAPFRCMDEFDVFMDMINRRVIMDLLVKLATEQYSHNQFIFFTPQGIKELGEREHVQVFEMPKVRD
ncbi:hypothetical protein TELCIR_13515 [Teladorsagia circumcincta]|uniref:RecF/RecN/SMC protein n=1 Tax=Teladorsagia circumcincta TaxID=45464 RepID=A0A2G9U5M9_TELCI|nr:hypothetical protein TELCIR_13515 [Teladorsagia circumcincta]